MKKFATVFVAAIAGVAPLLATASSASAGPKPYYGKPYRGKPSYNRPPPNNKLNGLGAGLVAGAALGLGAGLLLNNRPPPPPPPAYYAPPRPPKVVYYPAPPPAYYPPPPAPAYHSGWSQAHVQWCYGRYRSYNAETNTFTGYDGIQRACVSPY